MIRMLCGLLAVVCILAESTHALELESIELNFQNEGTETDALVYQSNAESDGASYKLEFERRITGISSTTDIPGAIIAIIVSALGAEFPTDFISEPMTRVNFYSRVRLVGEPGQRALVTASNILDGSINHQIVAPLGASAWSWIGSQLTVRREGSVEVLFDSSLAHSRSHIDVGIYTDLTNSELASELEISEPFEMVVDDPDKNILEISGTFFTNVLTSLDNVEECLPVIGCVIIVPGIGFSVSGTIGTWVGELTLEEIVEPEPTPGTRPIPALPWQALVLLALGLCLLGTQRVR